MMKRSAIIYLCGIFAFISFYACKPNDANLQKDVQSVLVSHPGVSASVSDGIATLTGTVASEEMKAGAERATKAVNHIKSVNNNITVSPPVAVQNTTVVTSDDVLKRGIRSSLDKEGYNDVNIDINDGEVVLTGKIKRDNLQEVMQIANDASPKRVVNKLDIE